MQLSGCHHLFDMSFCCSLLIISIIPPLCASKVVKIWDKVLVVATLSFDDEQK